MKERYGLRLNIRDIFSHYLGCVPYNKNENMNIKVYKAPSKLLNSNPILFSVHGGTITVHVNVPRMIVSIMSEKSRKTDTVGPRERRHWLSLFVSGQANDLSPSWVRPSHHVAGPQRHTHTHSKKSTHPDKTDTETEPALRAIILQFNNFVCTRSAGGWWSVTCPWVAGQWHLKVADFLSPATFLSVPVSPVCLVPSSSNHWRQQWDPHSSYRRSTLWNSFPLEQHPVAYALLLRHTTVCAYRKSVQANAHMHLQKTDY